MNVIEDTESLQYAIVMVGSGFASTFFLREWLAHAPEGAQVLVIDRGRVNLLEWQLQNDRNSDIDSSRTYRRDGHQNKGWFFTIGFGGSSNCWTGCVPRMLPNDFELLTKYGVGRDWPLTYDELEPYYVEVEETMAVSGPSDYNLSRRSKPFPQPPHNLCEPELHLRAAYPGQYYPQATARARVAVGSRPACCASAHCVRCPINSKFTIMNGMKDVFEDPRVSVLLDAEVTRIDHGAGQVTAVQYRRSGQDHTVRGDFVALGANAIFNAAILLRSEIKHPLLGRRLHEQVSTSVTFDLKGMKNLQGSTMITGQGYMFYDGDHRSNYGGCMTEFLNTPRWLLRHEFDRWTERMKMTFVVEDLPLEDNRVYLDSEGRVVVSFRRYPDYGLRGLRQVHKYADEIAGLLPVESLSFDPKFEDRGLPRTSEKHIQGTVVMGNSADDSVVDRNLIHHGLRNLAVLGSSAFPTGAPANPTLTLSALSLMSARSLWT